VRRLASCLLVCLLTAWPALAPAASPAPRTGTAPSQQISPWSVGFMAGYGRSMGTTDTYNVGVGRFFVGYRFYTEPQGQFSITLRLELLGAGYSDTASGSEFGIIPGLRFKFWTGTVSPYFEFGIGPVHNSVDTPNFAPGLNFHSYAGGGVDVAIVPDVALTLGLRIDHVSNAGVEKRNQGITYLEGVLGLVFYLK
jgi:hypothetical protein